MRAAPCADRGTAESREGISELRFRPSAETVAVNRLDMGIDFGVLIDPAGLRYDAMPLPDATAGRADALDDRLRPAKGCAGILVSLILSSQVTREGISSYWGESMRS